MLIFTLFTILFNKILGEHIKYTPEIYNIQLPSGVKYYVKKDVNPCAPKALIQEVVTFHYTLSIIEGENVKYVSTSRTKKPVSVTLATLGITGVLPAGKWISSTLQTFTEQLWSQYHRKDSFN